MRHPLRSHRYHHLGQPDIPMFQKETTEIPFGAGEGWIPLRGCRRAERLNSEKKSRIFYI